MRTLISRHALTACLSIALFAGCGGPGDGGVVNDEVAARQAYLGLDRAIDRAIDLGFAGFNAASSANIPEQSQAGDLSGVMTINGKVDQGSSANKGMRLGMTLAQDYTDLILDGEVEVIYNGGPAQLDMSFKGLPNADFSGSLHGTFVMDHDLVGDVTLDLDMTGQTQDAGGIIVRSPGTIHVTGTATSDYGVFNVDVAL